MDKQGLQRVVVENLHFETALASLTERSQLAEVVKQFKLAEEDAETYSSGGVEVTPGGLYSLSWNWPGGVKHTAAAVQGDGDRVWAIDADPKGGESYTLACYSTKGLVWRYKKAVGPFLCVKNGHCYVLETSSELRYGICVKLNAKTGTEREVMFSEPSLENNLALVAGEHGCIFLISDNSGTKKLYVIEDKVTRLGKDCVSFVPVGYDAAGLPVFFGRTSFTAPWTAYGSLRDYTIPVDLRRYGLEFFSQKQHLLVTSAAGVRRVWRCGRGAPKKLAEFIGNLRLDTYAYWEGRDVRLSFTKAGESGGTVYAKPSLHETQSRDGTRVPYVLVQNTHKPKKGLLVVIYGAYGIPTGLGTSRWKPFLDEGWVLVFGLIRGGGDLGDAWADAARTYKKWKSVDDTVAVIKAAQKRTNISWTSTCLYGRSAGGYTLGAIVAHHGGGGLLGAAYAEVPFVDVLTTTSTPSLPLTILEYKEFGNPLKNPRDLKTIRELSPVDALPPQGAPAIFVLCRTSLNDREVFPDESLKWIQRLRGCVPQKQEKYLAITAGHGHFVRGAVGYRQKAEDFLFLNAWLRSTELA